MYIYTYNMHTVCCPTGECYVCASNQPYRKVEYSSVAQPSWGSRKAGAGGGSVARGAGPGPGVGSSAVRDFVRPKLVTAVRGGTRPRRAVRVLLNRKTAHSFTQVLNDINSAFKLEAGAIRKLYTLDGKQVRGGTSVCLCVCVCKEERVKESVLVSLMERVGLSL